MVITLFPGPSSPRRPRTPPAVQQRSGQVERIFYGQALDDKVNAVAFAIQVLVPTSTDVVGIHPEGVFVNLVVPIQAPIGPGVPVYRHAQGEFLNFSPALDLHLKKIGKFAYLNKLSKLPFDTFTRLRYNFLCVCWVPRKIGVV